MKKYLILLFILIQGLVFSATKSLSDIKTLKFDVVEKTNIKSKKREISYKIDFILPNKIKKEVTAPELNKGEIYIYDYSKNKKVVYLPMFNEVKDNAKKPQSLNIDEQVTVDILSYIEVEGYILPEVVDIKDSGTKVGNIKISNLQINPKLEEKTILNVPKK